MAPPESKHILFAPYPVAWGHIRPMLALAVRLVLERPDTVVTFVIAPVMLERAFSDVATQLPGASLEEVRSRLRVMSPVSLEGISIDGAEAIFGLMGLVIGAYPTLYQTLLERKPITCEMTKTVFEVVSPPSLLIADFFALSQVLVTRAATGNKVPILMFIASSAAATTKYNGPEEFGGYGDLGAKIDAEAAKTGRPAAEVGDELLQRFTGEVINMSGLPPMHDYEFFPQELPFKISLSDQLKLSRPTLKQCDGLLVTTFEKWESAGSFQVLKSWLADWGKDIYGLGPLLPLDYSSGSVSSRGAADVEEFLQRNLEKYGKKSVLFISFGTIFWPTKPEYIEELIDALSEKDIPFLFCTASPFAYISEGLTKKVEASGNGLLTKWAPQQYVLNHPAIGWFLSHGGHNSMVESLTSGVPMIFWPFSGDQPISSAIVEPKGASIELVEVRTGPHATKPIRRLGRAPKGTREAVAEEIRGVLDSLRGEKGSEIAQAAQKIQKDFKQAWEDGGEGKTAFHAFLNKYLDGIGRESV